MVIAQVPTHIKMRRCGYCMVKVGIRNMLEENGMSDLQDYIFWQHLCSAAVASVFLLYHCWSLLSGLEAWQI